MVQQYRATSRPLRDQFLLLVVTLRTQAVQSAGLTTASARNAVGQAAACPTAIAAHAVVTQSHSAMQEKRRRCSVNRPSTQAQCAP
jgi:hypothetical protein